MAGASTSWFGTSQNSKVHQNKESLSKYLASKTDKLTPQVLNLCWEFRSLFDDIQPGSVRDHSHRIELNTSRDLKAKLYPLRNESQQEAARKEITRLLGGGMIKEVTASSFQAPIVMAPKKSSTEEKKWRFCCDFRLLNEHTVSD